MLLHVSCRFSMALFITFGQRGRCTKMLNGHAFSFPHFRDLWDGPHTAAHRPSRFRAAAADARFGSSAGAPHDHGNARGQLIADRALMHAHVHVHVTYSTHTEAPAHGGAVRSGNRTGTTAPPAARSLKTGNPRCTLYYDYHIERTQGLIYHLYNTCLD